MKHIVYPYIPNSSLSIKARMFEELGIKDIEEIYSEIPKHLRLNRELNIPGPFLSEQSLERHINEILSKNQNCKDYLNFLGGGCWQHYVPSVCKTIASRDEFLTAYVGDTYPDHGKYQALFEYASLMAELLDVEVVSCPTYDWANAAAIAIRMASRLTGKDEVILPKTISPNRLSVIINYCKPAIKKFHFVGFDPKLGQLDLDELSKLLNNNIAAVYYENPSYLGFIETQGNEISNLVHQFNAQIIVGVDPISLGIIESPSNYGADIIVGDLQPLGIPMSWGGGLAGFIGFSDKPEYVYESPVLFIGIAPSVKENENVFGQIFYERTSYISRDKAKDFSGTTSNLYGIIAGVYLALMGPQGMKEIGENIILKSQYAISLLSEIKNIKIPFYRGRHFKEFVVNFDGVTKSVAEINKELLEKKIFGGKDLSTEFPKLRKSALFCITELHTRTDIERLASALEIICRR